MYRLQQACAYMKWCGSVMASKRRWRPLLIAALVIVMLALAWLPVGDLDPEQRSNKPFLHVTYQVVGEPSAQLDDIVFDIQQRIEQRHEWRLSKAPEARAWRLDVAVDSEQLLVLSGNLEAPTAMAATTSTQRFKVQGQADTYAALPEQFVKILIQLVENGHKAQSSL